MKLLHSAPGALAILLLAGCGRGEDTPGQPSAEERRALDNIAAKQDAEAAETFDTSPDSLVPAENAAVANEAAPANAAASNGLNASANASTPANAAAPR